MRGELGLLSQLLPMWQRVECPQQGPDRAPAHWREYHPVPRPPPGAAARPASPKRCPSRGPPVLPGPLRFHRARERARTTRHTSRDPIPVADCSAAGLRPPWPPGPRWAHPLLGGPARPSTFRFFTRWKPPGSCVASSERASRGLSVVFSCLPALGVGPPPHARSRLQARGRAASLSPGQQPGLGTSRPQRGPGRFQDRPPIPLSHLGTGLPGDGTHSLRICVCPSGARGLSVRHLRIVGHAPYLRTLLRNKTWAVTLLDSAAEVTICRQSLRDHLEAIATSDFIAVETADGCVLPRQGL
ncbi:hypothetical protein NDU88_002807 [Pleurodeles waltl]|uniref:Uncharacterized protein n=1 Tax=Pleurodeles waltl TaxID=8319 RepID=A0AAV7LJT9_PLEWA|nr:hypothetical protein NDU88_002807 [Pleurodeles waltl]